MEEIRHRLGDSCVDFSEEADALNENLAMCDEKVLEAYLEKEIERMYDRLAKTGRDTAIVSDKLTRLKQRKKKWK